MKFNPSINNTIQFHMNCMERCRKGHDGSCSPAPTSLMLLIFQTHSISWYIVTSMKVGDFPPSTGLL